jgi:hypothetical protein
MSIGMVTIEIRVGTFVKGVLPIRMENGQAYVDQFKGEVLEIKKITAPGRLQGLFAYKIDLVAVGRGTPWVIEYRIYSFDFGGIEVTSSKWNMQAVENENRKLLRNMRKP